MADMDVGMTVGLIKALGSPDPAVIEGAVSDWLDDHPEATTTVEDGAISYAKLNASLQETVDDVGDLKTEVGNVGSTETLDVTLESGTISSTNGNNSNNSGRVRTVDYISLSDILYIYVDRSQVSIGVNLFAYTSTGTYLGNSGFIAEYPSDGRITNEMIVGYFSTQPTFAKLRVVYMIGGHSTISTSDIIGRTSFVKGVEATGIIKDVSELQTDVSALNAEVLTDTNYPYYGERIHLENKCFYEYAFANSTQGFQSTAVCGDEMFMMRSNGSFSVFDMTDYSRISDNGTMSGASPHCNACQFGTEKYDESDNYPVLYVNEYDSTAKGICYVCRIAKSDTTYTATVVQTISIGFTNDPIWSNGGDTRDWGDFCVDAEGGYLYAITLRDDEKATRVFKFALPNLGSSTVTLAKTDIVEYFDVDYLNLIQDCKYINGKIYIMSGSTENPKGLSVIDTIQKKITSVVYTIGIKSDAEPESVAMYNGALYCSVGTSVYKFKF